jgi:hypothetical protein
MILTRLSVKAIESTYHAHLLASTTGTQQYDLCQVVIHTPQFLSRISMRPALPHALIPTCTGGSPLLVLAFETARFLPILNGGYWASCDVIVECESDVECGRAEFLCGAMTLRRERSRRLRLCSACCVVLESWLIVVTPN